MLFGQEEKMSRVCLKWLEPSSIRRVLDVGCGTGTLTIAMARKITGREDVLVVGMDAAPKMIDVASRKGRGIAGLRFDVGIAEELPYGDEAFDLAVSTFFFHHINFDLKVKTLNEMWRTLKKNAEVVIIDVDVPTNAFGKICAWSGYYLFQQEEIRENIEGKLQKAFACSKFTSWDKISSHQGYISVFRLIKT
jgi:ubiquinone/menaquinone biosynthesis C-methylase UbiE